MDIRNFFGGSPKKPAKSAASPSKSSPKKSTPTKKSTPKSAKQFPKRKSPTPKKEPRVPKTSAGTPMDVESSESEDDEILTGRGTQRVLASAAAAIEEKEEEVEIVEKGAGAAEANATPVARSLSSGPGEDTVSARGGVASLASVAPSETAKAGDKRKRVARGGKDGKSPKKARSVLPYKPGSEEDPLMVALLAGEDDMDGLQKAEKMGNRLRRKERVCKSGALEGRALAFSGEFSLVERKLLEDSLREYGGTLRDSVSSRTHALVAAERLEDGRLTEEGRKYKAAQEHGVPIVSEVAYLCMLRRAEELGLGEDLEDQLLEEEEEVSSGVGGQKSSKDDGQDKMWVDRWMPMAVEELVGNKACVDRLDRWLESWYRVHVTKEEPKPSGSGREAMLQPGAKAALLSGPPGVGKSSAVRVLATKHGFQVMELNASDARSKRRLRDELGPVVGQRALTAAMFQGKGRTSKSSKSASFEAMGRRLVVMDEVDGLSSADRGGNQELIKIIKEARCPIVCICNDRQKPSVRSLANHCFDLRFQRPQRPVVVKRVMDIAAAEGLVCEPNAVGQLVEAVGNDVRQVLHSLQMWANSQRTMTFRDLSANLAGMSKDAILRQNAFTAAADLLSARPLPLRSAFELFFVDYDILPLFIQHNYPTAALQPRGEDPLQKSYRLAKAAEALSDADLASGLLRNGGGWSLLPAVAGFTVKAARAAAGASNPEFPAWLGKNSARSKRRRLLGEMAMHTAGRISGGVSALRLDYLPTLRNTLYHPLLAGDVDSSLALASQYALSKEDLYETIPEVRLPIDPSPLTGVSAAVKTKLTKALSAAPVAQSVGLAAAVLDKSKKRAAAQAARKSASSSSSSATAAAPAEEDPESVWDAPAGNDDDDQNDQNDQDDDEEDNDEAEQEAIRKQFAKKKRRSSGTSSKKKKK